MDSENDRNLRHDAKMKLTNYRKDGTLFYLQREFYFIKPAIYEIATYCNIYQSQNR